jgi:hypothetical protein
VDTAFDGGRAGKPCPMCRTGDVDQGCLKIIYHLEIVIAIQEGFESSNSFKNNPDDKEYPNPASLLVGPFG